MLFSERYGYKPVREIIQKEDIDDDLRNGLWSILHEYIWGKVQHGRNQSSYIQNSNIYSLIKSYWLNIFKKPIDTIPKWTSESIKRVRDYFYQCEWHEVYSIIEETLQNYPYQRISNQDSFITNINNILVRENSAYQIVNNQVTEITSEQEIQSIEEALESTNSYSGVQQHLNQALTLMSDRKNPDYRNSMKESISAVEGICRIISGDKNDSFKKALAKIETKYQLHSSLKEGFNKLYSYTSDGDGIRHALLEESNLTYSDAKFMLVACTNFINYLVDKTKDQN